jgi:hypothetical protein
LQREESFGLLLDLAKKSHVMEIKSHLHLGESMFAGDSRDLLLAWELYLQ